MIDRPKSIQILIPQFLKAPLTYAYEGEVPPLGCYVKIPLGQKTVTGIVWDYQQEPPTSHTLKYIKEILPLPPMHETLRRYVDWVADYHLVPSGMVLKMVIGAGLKPVTTQKVKTYCCNNALLAKPSLTSKQQRIWDVLQTSPNLTAAQITEQAGVSSGVIKTMLKNEIVCEKEQELSPKIDHHIRNIQLAELSPEQDASADAVIEKVLAHCFSPFLLDGVTGSGKTEVYLKVIVEILTRDPDAQVVVLLPEIALTSQIIHRFEERLGFAPLAWHSALTESQRIKAWHAIVKNEARVIVGARSALFLPYANLQLLIVDEEHDQSYKQEEGVLYHARDMAVKRAHVEKIPIILASATPSVETFHNVEQGKYTRLHLPSRHGAAELPDIRIVDMRDAGIPRTKFLSPTLIEAIRATYEQRHQSLLFLNRKGYAPLTLCRTCGHRMQCPQCSTWLVSHGKDYQLKCHHCGHQELFPKECPECHNEDTMAACGPGVERIAEEVSALFPEIRTAILTSDTSSSIVQMKETIDRIMNREVDVIIGTQVIAKGLHFPHLTTVGVIDADLGLSGGDLRASERTYQLLHQVAGRAGRAEAKGTVYLQTFMPDNAVMQALARGDRDDFVHTELYYRKALQMPPFGKLVAVILSSPKEDQLRQIAGHIAQICPRPEGVMIYGPVPAPLVRLRGQYRYRMLFKFTGNIAINRYFHAINSQLKLPYDAKLKLDIDPYSFM